MTKTCVVLLSVLFPAAAKRQGARKLKMKAKFADSSLHTEHYLHRSVHDNCFMLDKTVLPFLHLTKCLQHLSSVLFLSISSSIQVVLPVP